MIQQPPFRPAQNEQGFVLILSLVLLILLTLLGVWAMRTSDFENKVASNSQEAEKLFYTAEGANYLESTLVSYGDKGWYRVTNTTRMHMLYPETANDYNPRNPALNTPDPTDVTTWPWGNLLQKPTDPNTTGFDYRYLVTFLREDGAPGQGYSGERSLSGGLSSYKFRVQSNRPNPQQPDDPSVIETAASMVRHSQAY